MSFGRTLSLAASGVLVPMLSVGGCDSSRSNGSNCSPGSERCGCYGNGTCDDGFVCRSKICVEDAVPGVGGNGQGATSSARTNATGQGGTGTSEGLGESQVTSGQGGATDVAMGGSDFGGNGVAGTSVVAIGGGSVGGKTVLGAGGTTVIGVGGTTVIGVGGTTVIGAGGISAGGTTVVGLGGGHVAGATMVSSGGSSIAGTTSTGAGGTGAGGTTLNVAGAGQNLVKNGDFSVDGAYWHVTATTTAATELDTASLMDGAFCITASYSYSSQLIGWPVLSADAAVLTPGATYSLSFRARATYSAYLGVKVSAAVTPWLPTLATITASAVSTTWQQYRTTFVAQGTTSYPLTAATPIGLAFTVSSFTNGLVCLDDVVMAEVM